MKMKLTAKIVEALSLDSASGQKTHPVILLDGDILYITNSSWTIVFTRPEEYIDNDLLTWLREQDTEFKEIDWRVLVAKAVDLEQRKFLPPRSRKYQDILRSRYLSFPDYKTERCRRMVDDYSASIFGEVHDLTELYLAGKGRPVYAKRPEGRLVDNASAESFWFRVGRRVVALPAPWVEAFTELGFSILCPEDNYTRYLVPPLGLMSADADVFGFVTPLNASGITSDRQGREMYGDAAILSWMDTEDALEAMTDHRCHPIFSLPGDVWEAVEAQRSNHIIRTAVGVLRWSGWSDADIDSSYMQARPYAMQERHRLIKVRASHILSELQGQPSSYRLPQIEGELESMCRQIEVLQEYLGEVDLGDLPEAVAALPKENTA